MLEWLCVNAASVAVGLAVLAVVALAAWKVLKDKKHDKGSCSCGSGCGLPSGKAFPPRWTPRWSIGYTRL